MPRGDQFSREQRNYLAMEYHKHKGTRGFKDKILDAFAVKFPGVRRPGKNTMRAIWKKQVKNGTLNASTIVIQSPVQVTRILA